MERRRRPAPSKRDVPEQVVKNVYRRYLRSVRAELKRQFFDTLDLGAA